MPLTIPDPSLVILVGPSGSGKSTFARRVFPADAVLSSDDLRSAISGDPADQGASAEAFQVLGILLNARLRRSLLAAVDATNLRASSRRRWLRVAQRYRVAAIAVCFDFPLETFLALNRGRPDRQVEEAVVRGQAGRMSEAIAELTADGYRHVHVFSSPDEVAGAVVELVPTPAA